MARINILQRRICKALNLFSDHLREDKMGTKELVLRSINDKDQELAKDKNFVIKICRDFSKPFIPGGPSPV